MTVELLYMPGCPNHDDAADLVRKVIQTEGLSTGLIETVVSSYEEAQARGFPGSPTLRVNGQDIENIPPDRLEIGFACRTYFVEGRRRGVPPRAWVEQAIRAARALEENQ